MVVMEELLDFAVLMGVYGLVFYWRWRAQGRAALIVKTTFYVYLVSVAYFTLMPVLTSLPFIFNHSYIPMNLEPFIDVTSGHGDYLRQVILNVIMTVPFGFLLPLVQGEKKASFLKTVAWTFLLSLAIELVQPLISAARSSDITDIITNVTGGAIGYLIYLVCRPVVRKVLAGLEGKNGEGLAR